MTEENQDLPILTIDIVSDVVCPWCIIGYLQLQKALAQLDGEFEALVRWHPFELNPNMPPEGQDLREHVVQKYGSTPAQSQAARERLSALGDSLGFTFGYSDNTRMVNTFRAHQLLHWAQTLEQQTPLKLALFEAFFTRGEDVNDPEVLIAVAERVGLPGDEARGVIADGRFAEDVRREQRHWLEQDVHAVPTFYFNEQFVVPGAQEAQTFVRVLRKLKEKLVA